MNSRLNNLPGAGAAGDTVRERRAASGRSVTTGRGGRRGAQSAQALPEATISELDGVRYLHLGHTPWVQGAMRIHRPRKLELEYVQRMVVWLLLHEPQRWPQLRIAQLGLGAAALARFCHGELHAPTTVVEINPQVIAACRQWFRLPHDDERLCVVNTDAGAWVADAAQAASADVLCIDLYDHEAAAPVLDDDAFYRHCWSVLDEGGALSVNLFGRNASFARSARRIARAFAAEGLTPPGQVWVLEPTDEGNTIVLAIKGGELPDTETLARRAEQVQALTGLKAARWLRGLKPVRAPSPRSVSALTDAASIEGSPR